MFCAAAAALLLGAAPARAVVPHRSMTTLSSSNGLGALVYDATQYKITEFLEHAYQAASATTSSRNFAYDSYPGVRIGTTGTWLNTVAPSVIEYLPATGIIHTQRTLQGLTLDEYVFAPMALAENASVMLVKVTGDGTTGPVDVYSIFNYLLGTGSPTPGDDGETASYDPTNDAYYETGPSGVAMAFASILPSSYHGCTPNNPFALLNAGENLMDDTGSGGAITGAVEGFQSSLGTPAAGAVAWAGWIAVLAPDANGAGAITTARAWMNGRSPAQLLAAEQAAWAAWIKPAPAGARSEEAMLHQQSQAILRMGQVTESGAAGGQILAAITPGEWNISWVRDMAYSTVALVKSGHYAEAKAALAFQMGASVGGYQSYLSDTDGGAGEPYQISVCRYYGDGTEWSDSNSDGYNVEFDGFGLFLWALDEYVKASGDTASLTEWWPTVSAKVANVLVDLQEPSGMIKADSSIWEVHWDGQQRHFTYTTEAAANGLCAASDLATRAGDAADSATYLAHGRAAQAAIIANMRGPNGALGQSTEAIASGTAWLDASTIEAINWGLIDPVQHTASATRSSMLASLVPPSGEGFMRDQTGAYYDSQEWIFIDLRSARAFALGGDNAFATSLFEWNTDQGADNFDELSELHDATTANYAGAAPMVGFGAGAYILALTDRGTAVVPACGAFTAEPGYDGGYYDAGIDAAKSAPVPDGGDAQAGSVDAGVATMDAAVTRHEAGVDAAGHAHDAAVSTSRDGGASGRAQDGAIAADASVNAGSSSGGCAAAREDADAPWAFAVPLLALGVAFRRKRG